MAGTKLSRKEKKKQRFESARYYAIRKSGRVYPLIWTHAEFCQRLKKLSLLEGHRRRVVEQTTVGDLWVSTVFLPLNHQYFHGPPKIFETMIFGKDGDEDRWRYSTYKQAKRGHVHAVRVAMARIKN